MFDPTLSVETLFAATPRFKYTDYWGFEINILVELARVLNFTYTIENPPDGKFFHKNNF